MGAVSRFDGGERGRAVAMVAGGASFGAAAKAVGASKKSVQRWCLEDGVKSTMPKYGGPQPLEMPDDIRRMAIDMVRAGESFHAAGVAVGASMQTVRRWCIAEGVRSTAKPGFKAGTKIPARCRPSVKRKPTAASVDADASRKAERERRRRAAKIHNIWLALMDYRAAVEAAGADV